MSEKTDLVQLIIDHFTEQQGVSVFTGFGSAGLGQASVFTTPADLKRTYTHKLGDSPLSFVHDDEADHGGPLQEGCYSCGILNHIRRVLTANKTEARKHLTYVRQTVRLFGEENVAAQDEIVAACRRLEKLL